jgi:(+)-pinoresinol hydroxylase
MKSIRYAGALLVCASALAAHAAQAADSAGQGGSIRRGEHVYETYCVACHGPGIGNPGLNFKPGTDALRAKYQGTVPPVLSDRTNLPPEFIKYAVRNGMTVMPFFRKTEISDDDLKDLTAYLTRNNDKQ